MTNRSALRDQFGFLDRNVVDGLWACFEIGKLPKETFTIIGLKTLLLPTGFNIVALDEKKPEEPNGFWLLGSAMFMNETFTIKGKESLRTLSLLKTSMLTVTFEVEGGLGFHPSLVANLGIYHRIPKTKPSPLLNGCAVFGQSETPRPVRRNASPFLPSPLT